jgi:phosphatidylserine decarboxylase
VAATLIVSAASIWWLGPWGIPAAAIGLLLTAWCVWFFRDPERATPQSPGVVVSPADGVIVGIGPAAPPPELGLTPEQTAGMTRVSIFMNVFNVHVNRSPAAGTVKKIAYKPGKFFNASLDKASEHNERSSLLLELPDLRLMPVVQIAGLVARRIVCRVKEGDQLAAGQRYGLIRFGSRVDVFLPQGVEPLVQRGQRAVAGITVLAQLQSAPAPQIRTVPQRSAAAASARSGGRP